MSDTTQSGFLRGPAADMEQKSEEPKWEDFDSSRFTRMRYDPETLKVSVLWKNGKVGYYLNVPPEEYEKWRTADSVGKHLNQHIIPHFQYVPGDQSSS